MKKLAYFLMLLVAGFAVTACDDDDDNDNDGNGTTATANVYIYHASPGAPNVDIWVDGEISGVTNVPFGGATQGYIELPAGDREVAVVPAGGDLADAVATATLTLADGANYSVFASGVVGASGDEAFRLNVFEDDLAQPAEGSAHIRVLHLSANAPTVDVVSLDAAGDSTGTAITGFTGLSYPSTSGAFSPLPQGDYVLGLAAAGDSTVAFEIGAVNLASRRIYTAVALGNFGGTEDAFTVDLVANN